MRVACSLRLACEVATVAGGVWVGVFRPSSSP